jgi:hypothetical protein
MRKRLFPILHTKPLGLLSIVLPLGLGPWVSVESPISHFIHRQGLREPIHAHVLDINTTLHGVNQYGQVKAGYIKISGPLGEVMSGRVSNRWPYQPMLFPVEKFLNVNDIQQRNF